MKEMLRGGVLLLFFLCGSAFAEESGHGAQGPTLGLLWLNFCLFYGGLFFLLRKKILSGWEKRAASLSSTVKDAQSKLSDAEKNFSEAEELSRSLPQRRESLTQQIAEEAIHEVKFVKTDTEQRIERIKARVDESIRTEEKRALIDFRTDIIDEVLARARKTIKSSLSLTADKRLRGEGISHLEKVTQQRAKIS